MIHLNYLLTFFLIVYIAGYENKIVNIIFEFFNRYWNIELLNEISVLLLKSSK